MLAKVAGSNQFKVGTGDESWSELPWSQDISNYISSSGSIQLVDDHLEVDFNQMPTERYESLLKSLRLPIWLTENTNFYVSPDGSDVLSEGRGLSPELAFKNIQTCVDYVCENYNLCDYTVQIICAENSTWNIYNETIKFKNYTRTLGTIVVNGQNSTLNFYYTQIKNSAETHVCGFYAQYSFKNFTINIDVNIPSVSDLTYINSIWGYAVLCNIKIYIRKISPTNLFVAGIYGVNVSIQEPCIVENLTSVKADKLLCVYGGQITQRANLSVSGPWDGICVIMNNGKFIRSSQTMPVILVVSGKSVTGKKYTVSTGSSINTYHGGENYFPGTTAGTVDKNTYCWYI